MLVVKKLNKLLRKVCNLRSQVLLQTLQHVVQQYLHQKIFLEIYFEKYPDAEIIGYLNGYKGLLLGNSIEIPRTIKNKIENFYELGGSPIGNSRVKLTNKEDCIKKGYVKEGENPLKIAAEQLVKDEVTILHTIGGDDTNTTAADLSFFLKKNNYLLIFIFFI